MTPVTEPEWLDDDELSSWVAFIALVETLPRALDAQLKNDGDINHFEYSILALLSANEPDGLSMSRLAEVAFGSPSRLSHAVARLEGRGWVFRSTDANNARKVIARLTDTGRAEIERIAPGHAREVRRLVVNPLSPRELRSLGAIARKLLDVAQPGRVEAIQTALHSRQDLERRPT